jgi:uncharacterized protein YlxP (DUF503 family)
VNEAIKKRNPMELLIALEEKVKTLIFYAKSLKEQLYLVQQAHEELKSENQELNAENIKLTENNALLANQLNAMENSILLETGHVNELKEERSVTRSVLDDLIKSIDSIVENEN